MRATITHIEGIPVPHPCDNCGVGYELCLNSRRNGGRCCCSHCASGDTHNKQVWETAYGLQTKAEVMDAPPKPGQPGFVVKDSGKRQEYENGFVRDTEDDKPDLVGFFNLLDLDLVPLEQLNRWLTHMRKGAEKYGRNNWQKASDWIAVHRFRRSACRHMAAWLRGETDEDHAAAIVFNIWAAEETRRKLED